MADLTLEALNDLQGIILTGYGHLNHAAFLFVQVRDAAKGKAWLLQVIPETTTAKPWPVRPDGTKEKPEAVLSVGFTHRGLSALGLPAETLASFSTEFVDGIAARASILGDSGESAPEKWDLGGPTSQEIHAVLMIDAREERLLEGRRAELRALIQKSDGGVVEVAAEEGMRPRTQREPFGFSADGISQPLIEGSAGNPMPGQWVVRTGEFILGYLNEFDVFPPSPSVPLAHDPGRLLPQFPGNAFPACRDLGRHGTYLVYRKLAQDVAGFWQFIEAHAEATAPAADPREKQYAMRLLAAKMMGRWPSGAPLVLSPDRDDPALRNDNSFTYRPTDEDGYACPIGAHVRRVNPRDSLRRIRDSLDESFRTSNQHRLLRRGVPYGEPLFGPMEIEHDRVPLGLQDDGHPRGLHFFAINADIQRQFEFVQQTWIDNPKFNGLEDNKDPITGDNDGTGHMTIQRRPVRRRIRNVPRFVTVKGGAYFFLPSITAMRFLAAET